MNNYCKYLFNKDSDHLDDLLLIDGDAGKEYTYLDAQKIVKRISNYFKALGFRQGDKVAMHIYNSAEAVFTHMALQYIGCVSCFLDPLLKATALDYYLTDTNAKALISHVKLGSFPEFSNKVELINSDEILQVINNDIFIDNDSSCYSFDDNELSSIFYTSGTTSMPKGVGLTTENYFNHVKIFNKQCYSYEKNDRLICFVPFSHGFGSKSLFLPCMEKGISMVIIRSFHPRKVADHIEKYNVTHIFGVPSHYQQLLKAKQYHPQLKRLKAAFTAAALLNIETAKEWKNEIGIYLDEGFGLIETSTGICFRTNSLPEIIGHVGNYPKDLISIEILDENQNVLSNGERGEIGIKGKSVMGGYLNKPEENKKSIKNGWFLTGDVGYKMDDNSLVLTGRKKDIINIAGLKVCPFEVESVINEIPEVHESSVIGVPDATYGEVVSAFIILEKGTDISERSIVKYASTRLPGFQVPRAIYFLDEFPRNNMGKIDKNKLKVLCPC